MIRKNRSGNDQLITLRSSEGERQAFVAGLDWVSSPFPPGRIDVWRKARSIGASAYVPQGTLSGYCVSPEGRDLVGLPSLAAQLLEVLENSKDSVLIVLKDQAQDTLVRDTRAGSEGNRADVSDKGVLGKGDPYPESDSARFALIQIADGLILPTWDRILGQEDMLSLVGSLQEQVSRILMDTETLELLPDSIFGNDRIAAFEADRLFAPGSGPLRAAEPPRAAGLSQATDSAFGAEGRLQKLPFDPGQSVKLAVIAACLIGGLLWFFEDSMRLFSDPVPEVARTAPVVPETEILSPASLLQACHAAFYKTWQAAEITPLGFKATGVSCLAQPDDGPGGKSATGLVGPIIRYSWLLPAERNPALYRLLAEQSFRHWDYAVVTDRQAVSAFVLPVESISLGPEDIPSLVEFRRRLDQAFGLEAEGLALSRNGQTTLFVFRTAAGLGVVSKKALALPEMEITGLTRDLRQSTPFWEISGRLAAIDPVNAVDAIEGGMP